MSLFLICLGAAAPAAAETLLACAFTDPGAPCVVGRPARALSNYQPGEGLRLCKGAGCKPSGIVFNGPVISRSRGTISFWIRQNALGDQRLPFEIFSTYPELPALQGTFEPTLRREITQIGRGPVTMLTVPNHQLKPATKARFAEAAGPWAAVDGTWTVTVVDKDRVTIPLDSRNLPDPAVPLALLTLGKVSVHHMLRWGTAFRYGAFDTDAFLFLPGEWHHIVWTWNGDVHRLYRNGRMVSTTFSESPFGEGPHVGTLRIGVFAGGVQDVTVAQFQSFDFAASADEVAAASRETGLRRDGRQDPRRLTVAAQWGFGTERAKFTVDLGRRAEPGVTVAVEALRDGDRIGAISVTPRASGIAEGLVALGPPASGRHRLVATVKGRAGSTGATVSTEETAFEKPPWLGNRLGLGRSVPWPHWDPIEVIDGQQIKVVNRVYDLSGGFGLPAQILALGRPLLAEPLGLDFHGALQGLELKPKGVQFTSIAHDEVRWTGRAELGGVLDLTVHGRAEYDGLIWYDVEIAPRAGPLSIEGLVMRTALRSEAAKYAFARKDHSFSQTIWAVRVPTPAGEFNTNLTTRPKGHRSEDIFGIVLSDDDRGLEIIHTSMAGWLIDEKKPWQRLLRSPNGSVVYEAAVANHASVIEAPIRFDFGIMATPVRRLPLNWRLATGGAYGGSRAPDSDLEFHFDFSLKPNWSTFDLEPLNLQAYRKNAAGIRAQNKRYGKKVLPFTNAHVLVPTPRYRWDDFGFLRDETLNDGWHTAPSRTSADFWAYTLDRLLNEAKDAIDGYYVDESYSYLPSASLLAGGYVKPDGTHGFGLDLRPARDQFRRVARILISHGKGPNIWFHSTANALPHVWSHGLMTLDGELPMGGGRNYYASASAEAGPDHFDLWNRNDSLIDPEREGYGAWLLGISRAQKFGFIPLMWRGIECCHKPLEKKRMRQAQCLYQAVDVVQQDQTAEWWQIKNDFRIGAPGVTFQMFNTQTVLTSSAPKVRASVYRRGRDALAYILNFGSEDVTAELAVDPAAAGPVGVLDAETKSAIETTGNRFSVAIPRHDCRVVILSNLKP